MHCELLWIDLNFNHGEHGGTEDLIKTITL